MRPVEEHAEWWDTEFGLLWPQAGMVLGDRIASDFVSFATDNDPDGPIFFVGPGLMRSDPTAVLTDFAKLPLVKAEGGAVLLEVPHGVRNTPLNVLDRMHHVRVRGLHFPHLLNLPAEVRLSLGFDANPDGEAAGVDLMLQGALLVDIPAWAKFFTGTWMIEQLTRDVLSGIVTLANMVAEGISNVAGDVVPAFRQLRYARADDTVRYDPPEAVDPTLWQVPVEGGERVDWWDIVFVGDGFAPPDRGAFDELVARATHRLTGTWPAHVFPPPSGTLPADIGARSFGAFGTVIRTFRQHLPATPGPRILIRDDFNNATTLANLAPIAEAALHGEDFLGSEYPGTERPKHRVTYVLVQRMDAGDARRPRAAAYGNLVLLPLGGLAGGPEAQAAVLIHELGHLRHFALADEYWPAAASDRSDQWYQGPEPQQMNVSRVRDPEKWDRFSVPGVMGGYDFRRGVFRPQDDCRMRRAGASALAFCPVCQDSIATGALVHVGHARAELAAPMEVEIRFDWPFLGQWTRTLAAGVGPGTRPGALRLPVFTTADPRFRVETRGEVTVRRAAVPAPWTPGSVPLAHSFDGRVDLTVTGTHPNVGFTPDIVPKQTAEAVLSRHLLAEHFEDVDARAEEQSLSGDPAPAGTIVPQRVDPDTADLVVDLEMSASAHGPAPGPDGLHLLTETAFLLTRVDEPLREDDVAPNPAAFRNETDSTRQTHAVRQLPPGRYRWEAQTRLALPPEIDHIYDFGAHDRYSPTLTTHQLPATEDGWHFEIRPWETEDLPPWTPVPVAAGRVRLTYLTDSEGRVVTPPPGARRDFEDSGLFVAPPEIIEELGKTIPASRLPRLDFARLFGQASRRVNDPRAALERFRNSGTRPPLTGGGMPSPVGPGMPDLPTFDIGSRFDDTIPLEPGPIIGELVRVTMVVMLAWSHSPAGQSLTMEFQRAAAPTDGDEPDWVGVPVSAAKTALTQDTSGRFVPDNPELTARIVGFNYTGDADEPTLWRARARDISDRPSDWSDPAPLLDFNTHLIPTRLGTPDG